MVNPAITGTAIIKALDRENELAANATQMRQEQAALDEAELHDLEQVQYYGPPPRPQIPATKHRAAKT